MTNTTPADPSQSDDEITLPEGVSREDVRVESEVEAFVLADSESGQDHPIYGPYDKPFNPQNGRYYDDQCWPDYDNQSVTGAFEIDCAYEDCTGTYGDMVSTVPIGEAKTCDECGQEHMGRAQFLPAENERREDKRNIHERVASLFDPFSKEMKRLTDAGVGPAAAMDYLMCSVGEMPYEEWAQARDVEARTVKRNMKRVATTMGETVHYKSRGY